MLKLASKFVMDIFPSVIATIIGAYIVNHYINNRSPADGAATSAAVSSVNPKKEASKVDSKPIEKSADLGNIPEPGVRAKGISEKAITDRVNDKTSVEKPTDKSDKPSETASIPASVPAETRRHQPIPREKAASKTTAPAASAPAVPTSEPAIAANPPPAEAAPDANDLARAAIERLRGNEPSAHVQDGARAPETSHVVVTAPVSSASASAPAVTVPSVQPLPPPILVSTPTDLKSPSLPKRVDDPLRPTPPADIPDPQPPLDLRADAVDVPPKGRPSVAEDVLSAAKSMFHSVLPK